MIRGVIRVIDKRERIVLERYFSSKHYLKTKLKEITLRHWNNFETGEWVISVLMDSDDTIITTTKGI